MNKIKKILLVLLLAILAYSVKFILFDFNVSSGKRVGNLTKISKRGKFLKTWEGTIDEGSGDKLTSYFSVSSEKIGQELYEYEGRQVIIYYVEHLFAFPFDTKYDIVSWKPKSEGDVESSGSVTIDTSLISKVETTLFCSFIGALRSDRELYLQVKNFIKKNNHFLFQQYGRCNSPD